MDPSRHFRGSCRYLGVNIVSSAITWRRSLETPCEAQPAPRMDAKGPQSNRYALRRAEEWLRYGITSELHKLPGSSLASSLLVHLDHWGINVNGSQLIRRYQQQFRKEKWLYESPRFVHS